MPKHLMEQIVYFLFAQESYVILLNDFTYVSYVAHVSFYFACYWHTIRQKEQIKYPGQQAPLVRRAVLVRMQGYCPQQRQRVRHMLLAKAQCFCPRRRVQVRHLQLSVQCTVHASLAGTCFLLPHDFCFVCGAELMPLLLSQGVQVRLTLRHENIHSPGQQAVAAVKQAVRRCPFSVALY